MCQHTKLKSKCEFRTAFDFLKSQLLIVVFMPKTTFYIYWYFYIKKSTNVKKYQMVLFHLGTFSVTPDKTQNNSDGILLLRLKSTVQCQFVCLHLKPPTQNNFAKSRGLLTCIIIVFLIWGRLGFVKQQCTVQIFVCICVDSNYVMSDIQLSQFSSEQFRGAYIQINWNVSLPVQGFILPLDVSH